MGIIGNVSLINSKMGGQNNVLADNLKAIEQCVESGSDLTRQLLGYARGGKYQVKAINLNDMVKESSELFGRTKREIHIESHYQDAVWTVKADKGQIEQVLMNLYLNAWQAMTEDMTLFLKTKNITLDASAALPLGLKPGSYVTIEVQDRGRGIAPEIIKRIFEPFFTTKPMGRGTGLGLAAAFGIINNHGGAIDVFSHVGRGTTFIIYLPAVAMVPEKTDKFTDAPRQGSGTLLVVDDEKYILDASAALLTDMGYQVIPANSGYQAIAEFKEKAGKIDGVLLDMIMPDLNGRQVLAELRKIKPSVRVILSSGYSLTDMEDDHTQVPGDGFIQKPYTMNQLAATLSSVLEDSKKTD
jgi:CheY-like chemotaxis protein